jgi:phosphatidylglycerol:prolipoprotein diacylglycerol transferase
MYPEINILGTSIPTYLLCVGLGLIVSIKLLCSLLVEKECLKKYINVLTLSFIGLFLGARLFGILSRLLSIYQETGKWNCYDSLNSGIVYLGGLLGYLLTFQLLCKIKQIKTSEVNDILAVIIPLFHSFGRIGCYFGGCCYGKISSSLIAVPYKILRESELWEYRIPTQLFESLVEILIFVMMYKLYRKQQGIVSQHKGLLTIYLFAYSIWRFIIEFFRGDSIRGVYFKLSFSQYVCILLLIYLCAVKVVKYVLIMRRN